MIQNDMVKAVTKTVDITIQTAKITSDILQSALQEFLRGKSKKHGKMSMRQLENKCGGKLESIEVTDNNIRDFLGVAKKYDVDFSLKRDKSTDPATYHVFFQANKADNLKRAFSEYANKKSKQIAAQKAPYNRQKTIEKAAEIAKQPKIVKEHRHERSKENVR